MQQHARCLGSAAERYPTGTHRHLARALVGAADFLQAPAPPPHYVSTAYRIADATLKPASYLQSLSRSSQPISPAGIPAMRLASRMSDTSTKHRGSASAIATACSRARRSQSQQSRAHRNQRHAHAFPTLVCNMFFPFFPPLCVWYKAGDVVGAPQRWRCSSATSPGAAAWARTAVRYVSTEDRVLVSRA